jgi:hypothetical protein
MEPALVKGSKVEIAAGPLMGLDAIYAGMGWADRVQVLLTMLGSTRQVEISAGLLAPR